LTGQTLSRLLSDGRISTSTQSSLSCSSVQHTDWLRLVTVSCMTGHALLVLAQQSA
jgi:hypothetical protein